METEVLPPFHRFWFVAHLAAALAGTLTLNAVFLAVYVVQSPTDALNAGDPQTLLYSILIVLTIEAIMAVIFTLPATYVCIVAARVLRLSEYWQFAGLGLLAAAISAIAILLGSSEGSFLVFILLIPAGVIGALTYRFVSPRLIDSSPVAIT